MTGQPSCKQRIRQRWNSRKADFALYMANSEVYENGNGDIGPFHEYGLSFDYVAAGTFTDQRKGYWRYQLSWGGPSDELRFYGDPEGKIYKVEYWFLDWYDGAHLNVTNTPEAQWLVEWFGDVGSFDAALQQAA